MKKLLILILLVLMLTGCSAPAYNEIEVWSSAWRADMVNIDVDSNYEFVDYQKTYSDDGECYVTLHYKERER